VPWLYISFTHCWEVSLQNELEALKESHGFQAMLDRKHRRRREDGGWQITPWPVTAEVYEIVANLYL